MGRRGWTSWALTATVVALVFTGTQQGLAVDTSVALEKAGAALDAGHAAEALPWIDRALEHDPRSLAAWDLRARWAEDAADRDELAYALYHAHRLAAAQGAPKKDLAARRARLESADPQAKGLLEFTAKFVAKLAPFAEQFEKEGRRHAAIRLHQQILALDPDRSQSRAAIERISAAPDPSLAETAKEKDLLADVSTEWIAEHDAKHDTWATASKLERENYTTQTDAGYEVMVRAGEAMEHMNAFYRRFFHYGDDGKKSVPRITLRIFKSRDEYLALGSNPAEWSGGQFTGTAVETYVGSGGFADAVTTLFHEAAHQFVGLATSAAGWLNEGLASFMEGSRLLANGTVKTNMPANHRLFPLAERLEKGWMSGPADGIDPKDPSKSSPARAPTWRTLLENEYAWGPPWYAPTWGVVYFLYDFQDEADGRFVYRAAFHEFVDASGARSGKGAVENFEKIVLAHPAKPTPGLKPADGAKPLVLPKTVDELDAVWKAWILRLRDEQAGKAPSVRPYLHWARCALVREDLEGATEHFERGLETAPDDYDLSVEFAEHLAGRMKSPDRAVKLLLRARRVAGAAATPDPARVQRVDRLLAKFDPSVQQIDRIQAEIAKQAVLIADAYAAAGLPLMTMDATRRFGADLGVDGMFERYEAAARKASRPLAIWESAYDGKSLRGWVAGNDGFFQAAGEEIRARFGAYQTASLEYRPLVMERVTSGDFSMETEIRVDVGHGVFGGLVFGMKGSSAFHALVFFPGAPPGRSRDIDVTKAYVDLASFYGAGDFKILRHNPVPAGAGWHTLRADVAGATVDVWMDGELVVTQEFSTPDVLRGGFGLLTGPGEARFRNVRFLARDKADPAAQIERKLRMEKIRATGGAIGGSWLGQVPPFPQNVVWIRNPRSSWTEKGPVPTLLVFWSIKQNNLVPVRAWLQDLAATHAEIGLEVVAISQPDAVETVEQHLQYEPFPGAVGVDRYASKDARFGATFEEYCVGSRFNLPRILLLDIDGKVVWEGDAGFRPEKPWQKGRPSYLDAPLASLLETRKLAEVARWRKAWAATGAAAVAAGDFDGARALLVEAAALPGEGFPDLLRAGDGMRRLQAAYASPDALHELAASLAEPGAEPALVTALEWAKAMKVAVKPLQKTLAMSGGENAKAWAGLARRAKAAAKSLPAGRESETLAALAAEKVPGLFAQQFAADLRAALDAKDLDLAKRLCDEAERRPARWLLVEKLGVVGR